MERVQTEGKSNDMSSSTGVKKDAFSGYGTASGTNQALGQNAANLYGSLAPELQSQAAAPQGYTPAQKAALPGHRGEMPALSMSAK